MLKVKQWKIRTDDNWTCIWNYEHSEETYFKCYDIFAFENMDLNRDLVYENGSILLLIQIFFNTTNIPFKFKICHHFLIALNCIGLFGEHSCSQWMVTDN